MIKCGITGANGLLGKKILKNLPYRFYKFKKDVSKIKEVEKWIKNNDFDIFIHCAALVPVNKVNKNYKKAYDVNVNGTINLVESLIKKKKPPSWFFFCSTSHVYKTTSYFKKIKESDKINPQSKYGKTKLIAEEYLLKKMKEVSLKICIGRIFSFTDKDQKQPYLIPSLYKKISSSKKKVILTDLNHYRDFLSTKDIVRAIEVLRKKKAIGTYNIGSGYMINLKKIAELIAKKFNKLINIIDSRKRTYLIADNSKISKLNWKPKKNIINLEYFY